MGARSRTLSARDGTRSPGEPPTHSGRCPRQGQSACGGACGGVGRHHGSFGCKGSHHGGGARGHRQGVSCHSKERRLPLMRMNKSGSLRRRRESNPRPSAVLVMNTCALSLSRARARVHLSHTHFARVFMCCACDNENENAVCFYIGWEIVFCTLSTLISQRPLSGIPYVSNSHDPRKPSPPSSSGRAPKRD